MQNSTRADAVNVEHTATRVPMINVQKTGRAMKKVVILEEPVIFVAREVTS